MVDVCIHTGPHDSSVSIVKNGELFHFIEERFSHLKHAATAMYAVNHIKEFCDEIGDLSFSNLFFQHTDFGAYQAFLNEILKIPSEKGFIHEDHHYLHAKTSYSHSGFDDAVILVIDGAGSTYTFGKENLSVYQAFGNNINPIYKSVIGNGEFIDNAPNFVDEKTNIGAGFVYTAVTEWIGFGGLESGKTMGLSAYGKYDDRIRELISVEDCGTKSCQLRTDSFNNSNSDYSKIANIGTCGAILNKEYVPLDRLDEKNKFNIAYRVQKDFEKYLIHTCKKVLDISKSKNLILTGGCALNCVANYKLLKELPDGINLYVDPTCDDSSVSIGGAYHTYHQKNPNISFKLKNLYKGRSLQYEYELLEDENEYEASSKDIAKLITKGNIVAIAQGRSEIGPRALGNRSILFDPRIKNGKDIVNRVKKREPFRPFAGTVLLEHARDWFDMNRLEESPFMTYAIDVLPEKKDLIPSIVHEDGTCRIQTLTREQNKNYYDLISEFYKLTGVPILFNTSFNLAGDTMVDTIEDGLMTLRNSELEYMYLPDIDTLIRTPNK
jgi:carbamoyltransferase